MQYWVINALDECLHEHEIALLLTKTKSVRNLRIILTSRNRSEDCPGLVATRGQIHSYQIHEDDSKHGIGLYLEANMSRLPNIGADGGRSIMNQILEKSRGCFLWVNLVFQELVNARTSTEIATVLPEIPSNMTEVYARILVKMSTASYGQQLAHAILMRTICSFRPLKVGELHEALEIHLGEKIDLNIEGTIQSCCGHLVHVDSQQHVRMIHLLVQDYLLRLHSDSDFAVSKEAGHRAFLSTCLAYLNGNQMKPPRRRKPGGCTITNINSDFVNYASVWMFGHLNFISVVDLDIFSRLAEFFRSSNVMTWIEYIANTSDLCRLIQTGKALGLFLQKVAKLPDAHQKEKAIALLTSWATDLVQLAVKFGKNLTT